MNNSEKQLELMIRSILLDAKNQAEDIMAQADEYRRKELRSAEDEALDELYGAVEAEVSDIKDETATHVTRSENDFKRELLLKRDEFAKSIFGVVKNRLVEFTATPEYDKWLEKEAKKMFSEFKDAGFDTLCVKKSDSSKVDIIAKLCSDKLTVVIDNSIKIGGFKLKGDKKGIFVDNTLDTTLAEQRDWFYANSGLVVV